MTLDRLLASPDDASTSALPAVIRWSAPGLTLKFAHGDGPVRLIRATTTGVDVHIPGSIPATDVIAAGHGRTLVGSRLVQSRLGASLRLAAVLPTRDGGLDLVSDSPDGLRITLHLRTAGQAAFTATTTIENTGDTVIDLHAVTSWASALGSRADTGHGVADWDLLQGRSDWLGEGRWSTSQLRSVLPSLNQAMTGHTPRSANRRSSQGTWSTGGSMPLGGAVSTARGITWLWQVENNGPWRWEIGEHVDDVFIALAGPTDIDHQWQQPLAPGESFTTVPATIALGADLDSAAAALTRHRRLTRRPHPDNTRPAIVFNDYMNTLNGDPTTQKLLPLVDAAAAVGAEVFCIDAGWYDDGGDWWPSVGAWQPSNVRFSGGLAEVTDRIRSHGMVPGLWLEPESVGVLSPIASSLPRRPSCNAPGSGSSNRTASTSTSGTLPPAPTSMRSSTAWYRISAWATSSSTTTPTRERGPTSTHPVPERGSWAIPAPCSTGSTGSSTATPTSSSRPARPGPCAPTRRSSPVCRRSPPPTSRTTSCTHPSPRRRRSRCSPSRRPVGRTRSHP
ncbi:hypothetical protein GW572_15240 (plasmid) [Clavibacter capsici]|nr:alpha-galactosidase [Clavibacter capsici]QIS40534.1 hypothetical protein GW572_15240 [Clavibacter capsici]